MKTLSTNFKTLLAASLLLSPMLAGAAQLNPVALQCEYRIDPLGIDVIKPRFGWQIQDLENTRGLRQTAYRLLVATSKKMLDDDQGNLWDSGKIDSVQSTLVPYGGKSLSSGEDCYWKVKLWTQNQNGSEETSWSDPARFSIGLLEGNDWKGSWIKYAGMPAKKDVDTVKVSGDEHVWYRKTFTIDESAAKAFVHLASLGYHELYVNGEKADTSVLAPSGSRIDKRALYVTYDVTDKLHAGKNVLAVWQSAGWPRFFKDFKTEPALLVQANVRTESGAQRAIASDATWRCLPSESQDVGQTGHRGYGGELIDARHHIEHWNSADYDDSSWAHAVPTLRDMALSAQMVEPDRIIETIKPVKMDPGRGGSYKVDMGKNFTGWVEIRNIHGDPGSRITIRVVDDPKSQEECRQVSIYVCDEAPGTFRNRFNYAGGRYVFIDGLTYQPQLADITGYAVSTDFKRTGHFKCSDELLNRIYETDLWT